MYLMMHYPYYLFAAILCLQFQTEISEKIPVSVQQACIQDWAAQQCMQVVCAEMEGTFYVNSAGEYLIKLSSSGEVVTPNKFEELAGKKTARNWQQSIRLRGEHLNHSFCWTWLLSGLCVFQHGIRTGSSLRSAWAACTHVSEPVYSFSIVGYTMNGEPNSALLKLGHFTRIVGLVQDR